MKSLKSKTFVALSLLTIATFCAMWFTFRRGLKIQLGNSAESSLRMSTLLMGSMLQNDGIKKFEPQAQHLVSTLGARLTLIDTRGAVLMDTTAISADLDNHAERPEVAQAAQSGFGSSLRYSRSAKGYYMYCARRVESEGKPMTLRLSYPLKSLDDALATNTRHFAGIFAAATVCVLLLQLWTVRHFFSPLKRLARAADATTEDETPRMPVFDDPELQRLASAMESMSSRLNAAAVTIESERSDLASILTTLPVGIISIIGGVISRANASALQLLGLTNMIFNARSGAVLPPQAQELLETLTDTPKECFLSIPERSLYLKLLALPLKKGSLLLIFDLSESRRLELAKRNFVADAAHEFQTPLTAIGMASELLLQDETDPQRQKNLQSVLEQQKRLTGLVDDLLELSRLESTPPVVPASPVDLRVLVSDVVSVAQSHPLKGTISLKTHLPDLPCWGLAPEELPKALGNLIDNGIKYTRQKFQNKQGGVVDVTLERNNDRWLLTVTDNGVGIRPDRVEFLFHRFQRGDTSHSRQSWGSGGYGLGLAIAKHIVENSGGRIRAVPHEGGACFQVDLPVAETQKSDTAN